ncbi:MAG: iron ABC transporter, partial [Cellvibrionales bacterium TMED148]
MFRQKDQVVTVRLLFLSIILGAIIASIVGSFSIPATDLLFGSLTELQRTVWIEIRLPRVILSGLVGASLGLSGAALQGLFRNPLADPGLIGVSAGAALGAAIVIVLTSELSIPSSLELVLLPLAGIIGASMVTLLLFLFSRGFGYQGVTYLLLIGIAVNAIASVGIGILTYISTDSELRSLTFWTMGSFGGVTWSVLVP